MLLENRVAIITGGTMGIGKGIALKYAEEGCSVAIIGRTDRGNKTLAEITEKGYQAMFVRCDISDSRQVNDMVNQVINKFGKVDILVNNAALAATPKPLTDISDEEWATILSVNLTGQFFCSRAVLPYMKEKKYGRIINISSLAAVAPLAAEAHYSAAKAGLLGLTIDMAFELAPFNICVNAILPGITDTEALDNVIPPGQNKHDFLSDQIKSVVPLQRMGTPQDVAGVALFFASALSDFVTGDRVMVAGGSPLMPIE